MAGKSYESLSKTVGWIDNGSDSDLDDDDIFFAFTKSNLVETVDKLVSMVKEAAIK